MTVFEHNGRLLIVDCGVLFPEDDQPGVDVVIPDFTWIRDRLDKVARRGTDPRPRGPHRRPALPAARAADIPVSARNADAGLIEAKLKEHRIKPTTARCAEGDRPQFGAVRLRVPRGQPLDPRRGSRVAIRTAAGLVLHTGDFKMDQFPLDDRITDLRGVRAASARRASTCS